MTLYFQEFMKQQQEDVHDIRAHRRSFINKNINHLLFDRNKIIQQLLKVVQNKLFNLGESSLAHGIEW